MRNMRTNFALLMELTHITPKDINPGAGSCPFSHFPLAYRLSPLDRENPLAQATDRVFFQVRENEVTALMTHLFPIRLSQGLTAKQLLDRWLGEKEELWKEQADLLLSFYHGTRKNLWRQKEVSAGHTFCFRRQGGTQAPHGFS